MVYARRTVADTLYTMLVFESTQVGFMIAFNHSAVPNQRPPMPSAGIVMRQTAMDGSIGLLEKPVNTT